MSVIGAVPGERQLQRPLRARLASGAERNFGSSAATAFSTGSPSMASTCIPALHTGGFRGRVVAHIDDHGLAILPGAEYLRLRRHQPR